MRLSLRTTSRFGRTAPAWLSPSKVTPQAQDASPTTTTVLPGRPARASAVARPAAVETAVPACPASKRSKGLSRLFVKPHNPPCVRREPNRAARPVNSLWA